MFEYVPSVEYNNKSTTDLFRNYQIHFENALKSAQVIRYRIEGSPTPEMLSYLLYGDVKYYWTLLMINDITNPYYEWIKSDQIVQLCSMQKYANIRNGVDAILYHVDENDKKYYRLKEYPMNSGNYYDIGDIHHNRLQYIGTLKPVSAIEHELDDNEKLRDVLIVSPNTISRFDTAFLNSINSN